MSQQAGAGAPPLQLTPAERLAFAHYFSLADPTNSGLIQGHAAVPFFAKAKLPSPVLGQIWTIADSANNGFLTAPTFSVALRLIGHAQRGETPDESLIQRPGAPPVLEGIQLPALPSGAAPMSPQRTGSLPPPVQIRPEDRSRYTRIFASAGPSGGMLDGEKAKEIFVKSRLPFDKLGAIWNLADTKARGSLDLTDFIIGMHFIQATMSGAIREVPAVLPPGLYEAAAGAGAGPPGSPLRAQPTGGSTSGAAPQQMWGVAPMSPTPTGSAAGFGTPGAIAAQRTGLAAPFSPAAAATSTPWAVTPADKAKADQFFDGLDTERRGELPGHLVVPFFMQSKLSETILANIWDLSDVTQSGSLSREEFAVAMHLINTALTGGEVPQELPANLIPPSLRGTKLPQAVNPQQTDTQKDLFSLMDDDPSDLPVSTATAFAAPVAGAPVASGVAPSTTGPTTASKSSPFDDDFFTGEAKAPTTAAATPAAGITSPKPAPTPRAPPTDQSADYGNKSLQLNSTQKAVDDLQSKRSTLETGVAQNASTLAEIESRLATVRSTHETESRLVKDLEQRRDKQSTELKTLRDELIGAESELSRLKGEKDEIEQQVMHDREEVRVAKKRMAEVQTELATLKSEVEKLRKEGRQQKGMVAIAKKQLSTAEGEHEKVQGEHKELLEAPVQEPQTQQSREVAPTSGGLTVPGSTEPVVSPAGSTQSLNPFDRFHSGAGTGAETGSGGHGATAAGLAAGAAAATAGVGALHLAEHGATNNDDDDDPFGVNNSSAAAGQQGAPAASQTQAHTFDDAFGDDFAPSSQQQQQQQQQGPPGASFDDAFGSFDNDTSAAAAPEMEQRGLASGDQTAVETPSAIAAPETTSTSAPAPAPTADEVATDADVATGDTTTTSKGKGKEPVRGADEVAYSSSSDEDEDDDDDEGPEDLEGYRHAGQRTAEPASSLSIDEPAAPKAATTTAGASERFPELDESSPAPVSAGGLMPPSASTATSTGGDFLSSQNTGTTDAAFVDAAEGGAAPAAAAAAPAERDAPTPAIPGGFAATSTGGSGFGGGFDDDFAADAPSSTSVSAAADTNAPTSDVAGAAAAARLSPTNSVKTRRAPPPAPVRSGTLNSAHSTTTAAAAPAPAAAATTSAQVPAPVQQPSFDDFESSFADFGSSAAPPTQATPAATTQGATAASSTHDGFEDAFDDADFDFVPSFDSTPALGGAGAGAKGTTGPSASTAAAGGSAPVDNSNAFAGFDDAFGPAPTSATAAGGAISGHKSASDPSSAFSSFEDAFAPSDEERGAAAGGAAPAVSTSTTAPVTDISSSGGGGGAPPLPSRGGSTMYAPPPGPPPELAAPAAATAASSDGTAALPDDAPPVRQLAGMGFPRNKVIAALEKSNYRVEKALERLLADS